MNHTALNPQSTAANHAVAIIPARFASTRLPGKALLEIAGRPMILHAAERALAARNIARAIVATDDRRIFNAVRAAHFEVVMTSTDHQSGSDRLAEVAASLKEADVIVNVQGDEPLIDPETIARAVDALSQNHAADIATVCEPVTSAADVLSYDVVKVTIDEGGRALYFSRAPIPFPREAVRTYGSLEKALAKDATLLARFRKHTGVYAYRREVLLEYTRWPPSNLEQTEALEQLRALEHGLRIQVVEAVAPSIGVDTMEDLERVRAIFALRDDERERVYE